MYMFFNDLWCLLSQLLSPTLQARRKRLILSGQKTEVVNFCFCVHILLCIQDTRQNFKIICIVELANQSVACSLIGLMRSPKESGSRSAFITVDVIVPELWGRNSSWSNGVSRELPTFPSCMLIFKAFTPHVAETLREQFPFNVIADIVLSPGFWERVSWPWYHVTIMTGSAAGWLIDFESLSDFTVKTVFS